MCDIYVFGHHNWWQINTKEHRQHRNWRGGRTIDTVGFVGFPCWGGVLPAAVASLGSATGWCWKGRHLFETEMERDRNIKKFHSHMFFFTLLCFGE